MELKQYDTSGVESEHGCFVLYVEHIKAMRDAYAKGVADTLSRRKNLDGLDKILDKSEG